MSFYSSVSSCVCSLCVSLSLSLCLSPKPFFLSLCQGVIQYVVKAKHLGSLELLMPKEMSNVATAQME